jgi:TolA-binding protein
METTTRELVHLVRRLEAAEQRSALAEQRSALAARKARGMTLAALVLMVGLLALSLPPMAAQAQKPGGGGGNSLESRVAALESQVSTLQSENATQATQITSLQSTVSSQATQIANLQSADTSQDNRITPLETKTAPLSVSGNDFIISGKNVHIVDGEGSTESTSGLGNLTIGYNHSRGQFGTDVRTGSHNLILGDRNNYSSYGGLVAGHFNTVSGDYASVSGGAENTASHDWSSVSGGTGNTASGPWSSVSGGVLRSAPGACDWAAGGLFQNQ